MAKYSKHVRQSKFSTSDRPKIYLGHYGWGLLQCGDLSKDIAAALFCQKLNNAAPKRGLKA